MSRGWRLAALTTALVVALVAGSAAKLQCSTEAGTPQKAPAVTPAVNNTGRDPLYVLVTISWLKNNDAPKRKIEITTTAPTTRNPANPKTVVLVANRDDHFEQRFGMYPGDRVSVTADQQQAGFLQCRVTRDTGAIIVDNQTYEHRNDGGSVHCEWTRPISGLG
jgi:hypothetical protein